MLVFFENLKCCGIFGQVLGLFSVIDSFGWFCMESLLLVLHFSYYTSMTFLMMLYVILLSMLMILLSTLSVIRHQIYGNNKKWLLNLNLIYETLKTRTGSGLLISMLGKTQLFFV